ncbi:hypothetical protein [Amycolatopsis australiensis]|uniref:Uncharacterized protein n=1 Tax=Amycolatopsis australiensis TaxID=546364 RepID=A0A1K1PU74_9PSEU|nr:hypothetical protein [Amycolatopsis australiensis]SFW50366.1 hypothetical protein SAMN04489730_0941 [Amycolatopsis australiensis]
MSTAQQRETVVAEQRRLMRNAAQRRLIYDAFDRFDQAIALGLNEGAAHRLTAGNTAVANIALEIYAEGAVLARQTERRRARAAAEAMRVDSLDVGEDGLNLHYPRRARVATDDDGEADEWGMA